VNREEHLVELVDADGAASGQSTVDEAHQQPGRLHRAFSVLLLDGDRLLVQRRAAGKSRFPLRWANTCCGHPAPGQPVVEALGRRLDEELGVAGVPLRELGVYTYRADDADTGRVEYEYDHVLVGAAGADLPLVPDPTEVAQTRWVPVDELLGAIEAEPDGYAPWLAGVLALLPGTGDGRWVAAT
jgi:isopentenyl-diphosphate delta-isomerase